MARGLSELGDPTEGETLMSVQKTALKTAIANAWRWREEKGLIPGFEALRVFHGPGENLGKSFETCAASRIAIDRFGSYFWITEWAEAGNTSVGI